MSQNYPCGQAAELRSESGIIERIWKRLPSHPLDNSWLRLGAGDDAAVLRGGGLRGKRKKDEQGDWVLSCDQFLEGAHFIGRLHPPEAIGYKALARATSDLAAMGAAPRFLMLSLALPYSRTGRWLDGFLAGMGRAAREFGMVVIGGDTSRFPSVVVNLTVGGQAVGGSGLGGNPRSGHLLTRAGARPRDLVYVSGTLGAAQIGLELVLRGLIRKTRDGLVPRNPQWKPFLEAHLYPQIQVALGRWLAGDNPQRMRIASAAIDTSDGLSTDLAHICDASGVGARIRADALPAVNVPDANFRPALRLDPLKLALNGGEDHQLIFTVPANAVRHLPKSFRGVRLTQIGEIVRSPRRGSTIDLIDGVGRSRPLRPLGWDSFRKSR